MIKTVAAKINIMMIITMIKNKIIVKMIVIVTLIMIILINK